ncbi:MAG: hypothetical protein R2828_29680 [Saprospiraceae bacterium]
MNQEKLIREIVDDLGDKKYAFLNEVERAVNNYISKQSIEKCLTIVERSSSGGIKSRWYPEEFASGYIPRLVAFCRKKTYKGYQLDSALTDEVVQVVTKAYEQFYSQNSEILSKRLLSALFANQVFVNSFMDNIAKASDSPVPYAVKNKIAALLIKGLEDNYDLKFLGSSAESITNLTTRIVSYTTSIPIVKTLTTFLVTHFGVQLKMIIIKVLGTAAAKGILATIIKKIAAAKILAGLIALVGAKLGILTGSAIIWVLVPLIIAFIAREVIILPKKLGKKVSEEIRIGLSSQFHDVNQKIVHQIVLEFVKTGANGLFNEIMATEEFKTGVKKLIREVS